MEWLSGFEHYPNGAILYGSFGTLVVIHRQMIMTLFRIFVGRLTQSGVLEFRFPKKIAYAWYLQVGGSCDSFPWCSGTPPHKNHDSGCWQLHWSDRHWPITYVQRTTWEADTVEVAWVKNLMKAPHFLDLPILLPSETPHTNHCHASQIGLCPNQRSFGRIWDARLFGKYQVTRLTSLEMLLVFTKPALKGQISFGDDVAVFFSLKDTLQKRLAQNFDPKRFKILPLHSQVRCDCCHDWWDQLWHQVTTKCSQQKGPAGSTIIHIFQMLATACLLVTRTHRQNLKSCCFHFLSRHSEGTHFFCFILHVLILPSPALLFVAQVTPQQQQEIFEPAPSGVRKIVLTTNIAEVLSHIQCSVGGMYPLSFWYHICQGFEYPHFGLLISMWVRTTLASICPGSPTNGAWFLHSWWYQYVSIHNLCMFLKYTIIINCNHIITSISSNNSIITTIEHYMTKPVINININRWSKNLIIICQSLSNNQHIRSTQHIVHMIISSRHKLSNMAILVIISIS